MSTLAVDPGWKFWATHLAEEVYVPFQFHIAPDGTVTEVRLIPGAYSADYGSETITAVKAWSFKPFSCAPEGLWVQTYLRFANPQVGSNNSSKPTPLRGAA